MEWQIKTIWFSITREFPVSKQTSPDSPDVYISEHMLASRLWSLFSLFIKAVIYRKKILQILKALNTFEIQGAWFVQLLQ